MVALIGVPFDAHSSFLRGPALAPGRIREALRSGSSNLASEGGFDLGEQPGLRDAGDLTLPPGEAAVAAIERGIGDLVARNEQVLALGGDHSITYPIVRAVAARHRRLTILHLDAHPDLYDSYDGNRYSHACPFARIMEAGLAARLVQVGVRTLNAHQRAQAKRFGVEIITADRWTRNLSIDLSGPVYLSLDLDVLDPAFAPGVSHHEPGGVSTRDVLELIKTIRTPIAGADIVEYNPTRDPLGITAMVAAKCLKEIAAAMLAGEPVEPDGVRS